MAAVVLVEQLESADTWPTGWGGSGLAEWACMVCAARPGSAWRMQIVAGASSFVRVGHFVPAAAVT